MGRALHLVARLLAYGGGVVLALIAILTVVSVIGRYLNGFGLGPIKGDFELVEAGSAIAIFAFLPLAQFRRCNVTVDVFILALPKRAQCALGLVGDLLISLSAVVILWRFWLGFGEKFPYGSEPVRAWFGMGAAPFFPETTYELELQVWIPYALAMVGAVLFALISLFTVWRSLNWTLDGQERAI